MLWGQGARLAGDSCPSPLRRSCCPSEPPRSWPRWPAATCSPLLVAAPGRLLPGTVRSSSASSHLCAAPAGAAPGAPLAPHIPASLPPRTSAEGRRLGSARRCLQQDGTNAFFTLLGLQPRPSVEPTSSAPRGTLPGQLYPGAPLVGSRSWKSACRPQETASF